MIFQTPIFPEISKTAAIVEVARVHRSQKISKPGSVLVSAKFYLVSVYSEGQHKKGTRKDKDGINPSLLGCVTHSSSADVVEYS